MGGKSQYNELRPFEKGIDFFLHFRERRFTLDDIKDRYDCTYRQACRIRNQAATILNLKPAGFEQRDKKSRYCWEIEERQRVAPAGSLFSDASGEELTHAGKKLHGERN